MCEQVDAMVESLESSGLNVKAVSIASRFWPIRLLKLNTYMLCLDGLLPGWTCVTHSRLVCAEDTTG